MRGAELAVGRTPDPTRILLVLVLAAAVALGLWARLDGFGSRALAMDEYFSVRSVQFILERGVPEFPGGGYYLRGLPWQYATALSVWLFGDHEWAYRLPSLLFGLLSIVLGYAYARRYLGVAAAGAVAVALLLSSWHVEFSRFARMYTLFQSVTLLFLLVLDDVLRQGRWRRRYLLLPLAGLGMLSHALGILLTPLLFLPLLLRASFRSWWSWLGYAAASSATLLLCVRFTRFDARNLDIVDALPVDYVPPPELTTALAVPAFPFWPLAGDSQTTLAVVLALAALAFAGAWWRHRQGWGGRPTDPWLAALLVFAAAHLFVPAGAALLVLLLRYDLHRSERHPWSSYAIVALALAIGAFWLGRGLLAPEALLVPEVTLRWDVAEAGALKALWTTYLGWPDLYPEVIRPFAVEMPVIGLLMVAALGHAAVTHRHDPPLRLLCHPGFVVLYAIISFAVLRSPWSLLRYWFHWYPVVLCLIALTVAEIAARWPRATATADHRRDLVAGLAFLALFAVSTDFNPGHLAQPAAPTAAFRLGPFERHDETWYPRPDVRSPAEFVNRQAIGPSVRIVVENLRSLPYYLEREYAFYLIRGSERFQDESRERGTRDLWTDARLLSSPEEVAAYSRDASEVWLIRATKRFYLLPEPETVWGTALCGLERAFLSEDGRIEVLHIRLCAGAGPAASPDPDSLR